MDSFYWSISSIDFCKRESNIMTLDRRGTWFSIFFKLQTKCNEKTNGTFGSVESHVERRQLRLRERHGASCPALDVDVVDADAAAAPPRSGGPHYRVFFSNYFLKWFLPSSFHRFLVYRVSLVRNDFLSMLPSFTKFLKRFSNFFFPLKSSTEKVTRVSLVRNCFHRCYLVLPSFFTLLLCFQKDWQQRIAVLGLHLVLPSFT